MAKKYEELKFNDDFMFCKILEQNPALCRELLELILDRKVGDLACVNRQKPVEITANGKGVRLMCMPRGATASSTTSKCRMRCRIQSPKGAGILRE